MSVVRAPNTIHFFIFAVLLPVLPQLPKGKKTLHTTTIPKKSPKPTTKKIP